MYRFLERFSKPLSLTPSQFSLAAYLCELALLEYRMLRYSPSLLAASALYVTQKISGGVWDARWYEEAAVKACARDLCVLLQGIEKCTLQAIRKKYA